MVDIKSARGDRIRAVILESGKSQREVADLVGVTPQSITKWLKTGKIYVDNLQALADATNTDVRYIISGNPKFKIEQPEAPYYTKHDELHTLLDTLDQQQAQQLMLCIRAILNNGDSDFEINISVGKKKV